MRRALALAVALLSVMSVTVARAEPSKRPAPPIRIGEFSSQVTPSRVRAGADITAQHIEPGRTTRAVPAAQPGGMPANSSSPPAPALPSNSPLLQNAHPLGPGTLWYQGPPGQQCVYAPSTSPSCFAIVQPSGGRLDPSVVAAAVAESMDLVLPPIESSPSASRSGLTGDATWFWLRDVPASRSTTVRLGGETVSVTADPSAAFWSFGDGTGVSGGAGVAYRPGTAPAAAITHVYQSRCLPGDQGRDPNVLASCGNDGYQVSAQVRWTISFIAAGPVIARGGLPARTTDSTLVYPVSEARAFLVGGASG
jgi:hypothetical protein